MKYVKAFSSFQDNEKKDENVSDTNLPQSQSSELSQGTIKFNEQLDKMQENFLQQIKTLREEQTKHRRMKQNEGQSKETISSKENNTPKHACSSNPPSKSEPDFSSNEVNNSTNIKGKNSSSKQTEMCNENSTFKNQSGSSFVKKPPDISISTPSSSRPCKTSDLKGTNGSSGQRDKCDKNSTDKDQSGSKSVNNPPTISKPTPSSSKPCLSENLRQKQLKGFPLWFEENSLKIAKKLKITDNNDLMEACVEIWREMLDSERDKFKDLRVPNVSRSFKSKEESLVDIEPKLYPNGVFDQNADFNINGPKTLEDLEEICKTPYHYLEYSERSKKLNQMLKEIVAIFEKYKRRISKTDPEILLSDHAIAVLEAKANECIPFVMDMSLLQDYRKKHAPFKSLYTDRESIRRYEAEFDPQYSVLATNGNGK